MDGAAERCGGPWPPPLLTQCSGCCRQAAAGPCARRTASQWQLPAALVSPPPGPGRVCPGNPGESERAADGGVLSSFTIMMADSDHVAWSGWQSAQDLAGPRLVSPVGVSGPVALPAYYAARGRLFRAALSGGVGDPSICHVPK